MNAKSFLAFLGGLAVGAGVALLLAPTSGEELRNRIIRILEEKGINRERFDDIIAQVNAKLSEATGNLTDLESIVDGILKKNPTVTENQA